MKLPSWINKDAWDGFVEMRIRIKKPLTNRAMTLAIKKLEALVNKGEDPTAVLDQSTFFNWKGLWPEIKEKDNGNKPEQRSREQHERLGRVVQLCKRRNDNAGIIHRQATQRRRNGSMDAEISKVSEMETS